MKPEHLDAVSRSLQTTTEDYPDLRANQRVHPDTRRFATIFPLQVPEGVSIDCGDSTDEENGEYSDAHSRWEFAASLDDDSSATQASSALTMGESSALSAAEQIIAGYRAVHGSDHAPVCATTEIKEKESNQALDDQRSMYTLATSADTQPRMDMMWRPKPKVHMHRIYRRELIQAQSQAIAMMHNAGLKPTNKIQCRRRGCADILPNVEALKYHIHIHNIADASTRRTNAPSFSFPKSSAVECGTTGSKTSKNKYAHSLDAHKKLSVTCLPPRKLSTSIPLPALFSPCENTPEPEHVSTVTKALICDPNPGESADAFCMRNNIGTTSMRPSTPSRGRRKRNKSTAFPANAECNPSITMLLSPPSSPDMRDRRALTPHTNSPVQLALSPAIVHESDSLVSAPHPHENAQPISKKIRGSRSPIRALSPTRAMSPIRDGFRRIFSIGCSVNFSEK